MKSGHKSKCCFLNDFKGSALEVVLTAITEQKQVFEGAAHAFFWKPKLSIPDIYENEVNKQKFGTILQACLTAARSSKVPLSVGGQYRSLSEAARTSTGTAGRILRPEDGSKDEVGLSPCRYPTDELVSAGKEGRHETSTV